MVNEKDRVQSTRILASNIGCSPEDLKQKTFEKFASVDISSEEFESMADKHRISKQIHASMYNMHPDDTPAAIMIELIEEYVVFLKSHKKSDERIFIEMAKQNPELLAQIVSALSSGDMKRYRDLIAQNPEFLDGFMGKMADNEGKDD